MTEHANPETHAVEVELQIDQVTVVTATEATATVRCTLGPVHRGAPFGHIRDAVEAIVLELTQILAHHRSVEELDSVHTALVTLQGQGVRHLASAAPGSRWEVIQGTNPPTS
ncbi:hypothetical protein [Streptomyces sp. NPDC007172]|uniref:hypothetical protein n=1 Tax=Streptomyces sp. NPDC007172 TaxID=3364776 RepID=UPI0036C11771